VMNRPNPARRALCGAALLAALLGCKTLPFPEPELEGEYGKVLGLWTRRVALYSGLETRGFCRVVYLSPEFVDAQAKKIAEMRAERPDQAQQTREKLRAETATPTVFAVFYTPDRESNDWNDKDSVWRIALDVGLGETAPQRIERFERPFNAEMRTLYPYVDDYSVAYAIHFPAPQAPPGFRPSDARLLVAGALGQMEFKWNLLHPEQDKR
jgi:hypothetical protein